MEGLKFNTELSKKKKKKKNERLDHGVCKKLLYKRLKEVNPSRNACVHFSSNKIVAPANLGLPPTDSQLVTT